MAPLTARLSGANGVWRRPSARISLGKPFYEAVADHPGGLRA